MKKAVFVLVAFAVFLMVQPAFAGGVCSPAQQAQAESVLSGLTKLGEREIVGSGAWYRWHSGWYSMSFDEQQRTISTIADTEYCASQGRVTHMHIEFNGDKVAEATPSGGIRVLKSRP